VRELNGNLILIVSTSPLLLLPPLSLPYFCVCSSSSLHKFIFRRTTTGNVPLGLFVSDQQDCNIPYSLIKLHKITPTASASRAFINPRQSVLPSTSCKSLTDSRYKSSKVFTYCGAHISPPRCHWKKEQPSSTFIFVPKSTFRMLLGSWLLWGDFSSRSMHGSPLKPRSE
jgi:hypothetical protein